MNRVLYQLSYAAIYCQNFGFAEISFVIIQEDILFVKKKFNYSYSSCKEEFAVL